jgi:hypothetical protein
MVQALAKEAMRLEVPVFNNTTGVRILIAPNPARRRRISTSTSLRRKYLTCFLIRTRPKARGDEAVRPHQNPANLAVPRPLGEGWIITADRHSPRAPRGTVEADKAGAERVENGEIARRHYARWIDSDAESEPLMAAEEAIERRSALTRRDRRLRRHLPAEGARVRVDGDKGEVTVLE